MPDLTCTCLWQSFTNSQLRMSHYTEQKVLRKNKQSRTWPWAACSMLPGSTVLDTVQLPCSFWVRWETLSDPFIILYNSDIQEEAVSQKKLDKFFNWVLQSLKFNCIYQPQWSDFFGFPLLHLSGSLKPSSSWMRGPMAVRWPMEILLKFIVLYGSCLQTEPKVFNSTQTLCTPAFPVYTGKTELPKPWISSQYILFSTECSCFCSRAQKLFKTGQKEKIHEDIKSSHLRGVQFGNCH